MNAPRRASLPLLMVLLAGACTSERTPSATAPAAPTPVVQAAPTSAETATAELAGLGVKKVAVSTGDAGPENLWWLRQPGMTDGQGGLISGSAPEKDADYAHLAALGVKTIISVDGSAPDVEGAKKAGLTYIHIPTTYARVTEDEQLEVARAVDKSLADGNVYIHCHHGKHRSPAQAAAAAVGLGWMNPRQAVAFMKQAGTADAYTGLYACVAESKPIETAAIKAPAQPGEFVPLRKPTGIVDAMIEVDLAYDHLGEIKGAGWKTPANSPDLVPASEAGRLADHLRYAGEDPKVKAHGDAFMKQLSEAVVKASSLEEGLARKEPKEKLDALWAPVAASCKECHKQYRDRR